MARVLKLIKDELLVGCGLLSIVYFYTLSMLACAITSHLKYACVDAVINSKTYFGMEKDACVPTRPLNGVCLGVSFTYRGKEYSGYVQVDNDRHKIGNEIRLCVEKNDPSMFTLKMKRDLLRLVFYLLTALLVGVFLSIRMALWIGNAIIYDQLLATVLMIGFFYMMLIVVSKS